MKTAVSSVGLLVASLLASACCWVPALLGAGATGSLGFSATLAPYRTVFLVATGLFLLGGFAIAYRRPKEDCCAITAAGRSRKRNIALMWTVAALSVASAAYPSALELRAGSARPTGEAFEGRTLTLALSGLDCAGCAEPIAKSLSAVPGVSSAHVDFAKREASVVVRGSVATPALLDAVKSAGFKAKLKENL